VLVIASLPLAACGTPEQVQVEKAEACAADATVHPALQALVTAEGGPLAGAADAAAKAGLDATVCAPGAAPGK